MRQGWAAVGRCPTLAEWRQELRVGARWGKEEAVPARVSWSHRPFPGDSGVPGAEGLLAEGFLVTPHLRPGAPSLRAFRVAAAYDYLLELLEKL